MPYRSKKSRAGRKQTFWIAEAVSKHPGAFRKYIQDTYGSAGFTKRGTIKTMLLEDLASGTCPICLEKKCVCPTETTRRRARLAKKLRSFQ